MAKILLIKTGAAGDVVRTTVLLNALQGAVTWVIDQQYRDILPANHPHLSRVIALESAPDILKNESFDHIISLEEDPACAKLATDISAKKLTGIYIKNDHITYTPDSAGWFDMSLLSKGGVQAANEAKMRNTASFQQLLLGMFNLSFSDEPYCIYRDGAIKTNEQLIGIETRVGARWPNKGWSGYPQLVNRLQQLGFDCKILEQRERLTEYLDDIARCAFIISGDTLAMHVAMAYKIPSIALFNCTSPTEIYDYGTLKKVVSPLLYKAFYKTTFSQEVVDSISVDEVLIIFNAQRLMLNA